LHVYDKKGKKGKVTHYPPSYYRYNEKKHGIFIRLTKEQKEVLDRYKGTISYGEAIGTLLDSKMSTVSWLKILLDSKLNNDEDEHENIKIEVIKDENELKELLKKHTPVVELKADKSNNHGEDLELAIKTKKLSKLFPKKP
jgi:hypothetical protein